VIQRGRCARFLLEAAETIEVRRHGRREHFDGDVASEAWIARAIHLTHAAAAERREQLVRAETSSSREGHVTPDEEVPRRGVIICSTTQAIALDQRRERRGENVGVLGVEGHWRPDLEDVVMWTVGPDENAFVAQTVDDV